MTSEARMKPDPFDLLRSALEKTPCSYDFLSEYVTEVTRRGGEEDVFRRLALRSAAGATGASVAGDISHLYEAMNSEKKRQLWQWWHEKIRRELYQHEDLGKRLSWRYFV